MANNSNLPSVQLWIWVYAVVAGAWAYWCSRGSDGKLLAALVGFGVLAVIHWVFMWNSQRVGPIAGLLQLVIVEAAVIGALMLRPQLKEMGGMLNFLIPGMVAVGVVGGWGLQVIRWVISRG